MTVQGCNPDNCTYPDCICWKPPAPMPEYYDAHVLSFRWHQRAWMEREYRRAGERLM